MDNMEIRDRERNRDGDGAGAGLTQGRFPHCNYGLLEYDQ